MQNSKISTPINRKGRIDLLKYFSGVGVYCPRENFFADKFCPWAGLLTTSKNSSGVCPGGEMLALGND